MLPQANKWKAERKRKKEKMHPQRKELLDTLQSAVDNNNVYMEVLDKIEELGNKDLTPYERLLRLIMWLRSKA